jgi:hypothetical protein
MGLEKLDPFRLHPVKIEGQDLDKVPCLFFASYFYFASKSASNGRFPLQRRRAGDLSCGSMWKL